MKKFLSVLGGAVAVFVVLGVVASLGSEDTSEPLQVDGGTGQATAGAQQAAEDPKGKHVIVVSGKAGSRANLSITKGLDDEVNTVLEAGETFEKTYHTDNPNEPVMVTVNSVGDSTSNPDNTCKITVDGEPAAESKNMFAATCSI